MKKQEKFVKIFELSVSKILFDFVNKEVLRGTNISSKRFWNGFNKTVHQLAPINKKLIQKREEMGLRMSIYAAMIDRMDQNIGRLIDNLSYLLLKNHLEI